MNTNAYSWDHAVHQPEIATVEAARMFRYFTGQTPGTEKCPADGHAALELDKRRIQGAVILQPRTKKATSISARGLEISGGLLLVAVLGRRLSKN